MREIKRIEIINQQGSRGYSIGQKVNGLEITKKYPRTDYGEPTTIKDTYKRTFGRNAPFGATAILLVP